MKISIITLFPEVFEPILNASILKRAQSKGKVQFELINLRDFGEGRHQVVDARPYGGGAGMVLKADVLAKAIKKVQGEGMQETGEKLKPTASNLKTILTSASGSTYKQSRARELVKLEHIIIVCGHYEGVDQRFIDNYVDEEISIGDYVLTGGEIPAMVIVDSIVRLIPGVLEKPDAIVDESFTVNLLEHPHYTRPDIFEGIEVPKTLKSGNHKAIKDWKETESMTKTKKIRPDLLK